MSELNMPPESKSIMLGKLHDSLYDSSRSIGATDTILVGATYAFNLVMLLMITIAKSSTSIFFIFLLCLILVNILILLTFQNSRGLREKLHQRQKQLYGDIELQDYFDETVIQNYRRRYMFWIALDIILGFMVLVVSLLSKYGT